MPRKPTRVGSRTADADDAALPSLFEGGTVRWSEVDATVLRACVDALSGQGHAVRLSKTADGGALCCAFYVGAARPTKFFNHAADAEAFLREYTEYLISNS